MGVVNRGEDKIQLRFLIHLSKAMKNVWFALSLAAVAVLVWSHVPEGELEAPELNPEVKKKKKKKDKGLKKHAAKAKLPVLKNAKDFKPASGQNSTTEKAHKKREASSS